MREAWVRIPEAERNESGEGDECGNGFKRSGIDNNGGGQRGLFVQI